MLNLSFLYSNNRGILALSLSIKLLYLEKSCFFFFFEVKSKVVFEQLDRVQNVGYTSRNFLFYVTDQIGKMAAILIAL